MKPTDFSKSFPNKVVKTMTGYYTFIPNPLPLEVEWLNQLSNRLVEAERSLAGLENFGQKFPVPNVIVRPFVKKDSVLSSQIEGMQITSQQLLQFEETTPLMGSCFWWAHKDLNLGPSGYFIFRNLINLF